jgi:hypothetical protein
MFGYNLLDWLPFLDEFRTFLAEYRLYRANRHFRR